VLDPDRHLEREADELRAELLAIVRRHVLEQNPDDIDIDAAAHAAFAAVYRFVRLPTSTHEEAMRYVEALAARFDAGDRERPLP
jgi:septum formation topological specificity factor MinE